MLTTLNLPKARSNAATQLSPVNRDANPIPSASGTPAWTAARQGAARRMIAVVPATIFADLGVGYRLPDPAEL